MSATERYDLSRMLDRVKDMKADLEDIAISTVGGIAVPEIRVKANAAFQELNPLEAEIEGRLGDPSNYIGAAGA